MGLWKTLRKLFRSPGNTVNETFLQNMRANTFQNTPAAQLERDKAREAEDFIEAQMNAAAQKRESK